MPNWCTSTYICRGDKLEVSLLNNLLFKLEGLSESLVPNGFGKTWLGNLVTALGEDPQKIACRGEWTYRNLDSSRNLTLELETAWGELPEIRHLIETKYPSIKIDYMSEEPGMGIYITNDKDGNSFPEKYRVEILIQDEDLFNRFGSKSEAVDFINEITGLGVTESDDLGKALSDWQETREDVEYASYIEFEIVDD